MSHEIVFTSAPKGLKQGSFGFCTVIATQGIANNLADRLERLSGYTHAFDLHDSRAALNPVNFTHVILRVGGQRYRVLSRICDAGLDYTKRTNKLAHHVALEDRELTSGGPAWTLAHEGFCETAWDGQPRHLPQGRPARTEPCPMGECIHWKDATGGETGDAGWAGVLAEAALADKKRTVSVIYKPGQDVLPLVVEALSLVPVSRRWDVTFSTYFRAPAAADCQWLFLLDGTPEANAARRDPHNPPIDLCASLPPAQGGDLVQAARTGQLPDWWHHSNRLGPTARPVAQAADNSMLAVADAEASPEADPADYGLEDLQSPTQAPPRVRDRSGLRGPPKRKKRNKYATYAFIGGFGIVSLLVAVGIAIALSWHDKRQLTEVPKGPDQGTEVAVQPSSEVSPAEDLPNPEEQKKEAVPEPRDGDSKPPKTEQSAPKDTRPPPEHHLEEKPRHPFDDIIDKNCVLPLPAAGISVVGKGGDKRSELAKLFVKSPKDCELTIAGATTVLPLGCEFLVERSDTADAATWNVRYKQSNSVSSPPLVGSFHWQKQSLFFQWEGAKKEKYSLLKYCLLKLTVGDRTETCQLHKAEEVEGASLDFFASPMRHPWSLAASAFPNPDHVLWDYQIAGFPETSNGLPVSIENDEGTRIGVGKSRPQAKFGIIPGDQKKRVDVEMNMEVEKDPGLAFGCLTSFYRIQALDKQPDLQYRPINPAALSEIKTKNSQSDSKRLEGKMFQHRNDKPPLVDALNKANAAIQDNQGKKQRMKEGSDASVLDREIKKHEAEKAKIQAAIDALDALARNEEIMKENRAKCEFLESFFREIKPPSKAEIKPSSNARIECRVYLEVDGGEVVILQTKGFRATKKPAGIPTGNPPEKRGDEPGKDPWNQPTVTQAGKAAVGAGDATAKDLRNEPPHASQNEQREPKGKQEGKGK